MKGKIFKGEVREGDTHMKSERRERERHTSIYAQQDLLLQRLLDELLNFLL